MGDGREVNRENNWETIISFASLELCKFGKNCAQGESWVQLEAAGWRPYSNLSKRNFCVEFWLRPFSSNQQQKKLEKLLKLEIWEWSACAWGQNGKIRTTKAKPITISNSQSISRIKNSRLMRSWREKKLILKWKPFPFSTAFCMEIFKLNFPSLGCSLFFFLGKTNSLSHCKSRYVWDKKKYPLEKDACLLEGKIYC